MAYAQFHRAFLRQRWLITIILAVFDRLLAANVREVCFVLLIMFTLPGWKMNSGSKSRKSI
jgi:hypothetical protein